MQVKDLEFADIYLGDSASWLKKAGEGQEAIKLPEGAIDDAVSLRHLCDSIVSETGELEFPVSYEGIRYRGATLDSIDGRVYVLRRFPKEVLPLNRLGLHPYFIERVMEEDLTGLLVIAGAYGQGKTWTASSIVRARMEEIGGVTIAAEDPPEMPLHGEWGKGVCFQKWVKNGAFGDACKQIARLAPSVIFLGELRDFEAAHEALRASLNGRLVICTVHADGPAQAIQRIFELASQAPGGAVRSDEASSMIAEGMVGVLHQRLEGDPPRLKVEFLWMRGDEFHGVRDIVRKRRWESLQSEISLQRNQLIHRRGAR